jgi:hypothetical protein
MKQAASKAKSSTLKMEATYSSRSWLTVDRLRSLLFHRVELVIATAVKA